MVNKLTENIEYMCSDCFAEQRVTWQAEHKDLEITPGFYVKIRFTDESIVNDVNSEYMWVLVTSVIGTRITGTLGNEPIHVLNVKFGEIVILEREQIISHCTPEP